MKVQEVLQESSVPNYVVKTISDDIGDFGLALFKGSQKVVYLHQSHQDRKMGYGAIVYSGKKGKKVWNDGKWNCMSNSTKISDEWRTTFEQAGIPPDFVEAMIDTFGFQHLVDHTGHITGNLTKKEVQEEEKALRDSLKGYANIKLELPDNIYLGLK